MEPSLRSSSYTPRECKLKRTDPALHETIQRFVESLDMRISQYADINYAVKKLEGKPWYWLTQIGRSGYLVFLPNTPAVWIDEQFKHSYKIQIRVSSCVYEKKTLLIASLDTVDGLLRLEDAWILAGKNLREETRGTQDTQGTHTPFTQRWNSLLEFYCVSYKHDPALQGLRIEPAKYGSLASIKDISIPNVMIAQGEDGRRLRVQLIPRDALAPVNTAVPKVSRVSQPAPVPKVSHVSQPAPVPKVNRDSQPGLVNTAVPKVSRVSQPAPRPPPRPRPQNQAIAVPHEEYPDTYNLFIDGVKKGYAAVQDLDLSKRLKEHSASQEIRVKIEWNAEFSMYEINDILD